MINRRSLLFGAAAAPLLIPQASAATIVTTYVYAPHPDDETLYTAGYVTSLLKRLPNTEIVLVAVTDGGATRAKPAGWTTSELMTTRIIEQTAAWRALTGGKGKIIRLGLADGSHSAMTIPVRNFARSVEGPGVEHYAACNYGQSLDHTAVTDGLRQSGVRISRYANKATSTTGYRYVPGDLAACEKADSCYAAVGHRSVPDYFQALRDNGYVSRIVP